MKGGFIVKTYYERLKDIREDRDLTQSQVAQAIGLNDYNQYRRYEIGQNKLPLELLCKLCLFYNVSADYILFGKKSEK